MKKNGKEPEESKVKQPEDVVNRIFTDVSEKGKNLLNEGWENARHAFEENADVLKRKADELGDKSVEELSEDLKQTVRKNPLPSIGVAFGVGLLLGIIFKSD